MDSLLWSAQAIEASRGFDRTNAHPCMLQKEAMSDILTKRQRKGADRGMELPDNALTSTANNILSQ